MSLYARGTDVPVENSRIEIERLLLRYGAGSFSYASDTDRPDPRAAIMFRADKRTIRFVVRLPSPSDFAQTKRGRSIAPAVQRDMAAAETRRRWRALVLVLKAKLEAVASGIATFEDEFMAYVVLPGNITVADFMRPQIEAAYKTGKAPTPLMLTDGSEAMTPPIPVPGRGVKS